ncbi:AAA family ATPase [Pectinatus haikarae]|uniref:DNA repair exonuclease SbcCD ATPase subunit n=1 Tax=Pectinatus haikarae TaxID=349096 RepID=A0ABT9Y3U8_9FIRM|nr:AAA family ATPase [Pectinatus haikarae]MDQ0202506.1 DNA repair exonuclease SbcCD ATPase subunit [Pectinatus haikarae]
MIKINNLEIENVKRVKAVRIMPTTSGLTVIGGKNGQGKTSVLDAIAWALGGNKFQPSQPQRTDSTIPPKIHIELSNGLVAERAGKNSSLKVIDPSGNKVGQKLLDSFIDQLALNLPKFMEASSAEKGKTLLQIIGVGDKLAKFDLQEQQLFNRRTEIGRIADQKKKYAKEMTFYEGVPKEPVSASELIRQQQEILARNGENARKRANLSHYAEKANSLHAQIEELQRQYDEAQNNLEIAQKSALDLHNESTEELEKNITEIDTLNLKIRTNLDREKAEIDAEGYAKQYEDLTKEIETVRQDRTNLLDKADLPLPELTVQSGNLIYKNQQWDCMSASEQLKVATAIVRKLNPECGFVLMDKLEQMDSDTLQEFGAWLEQEGLQAIATRVSTSANECSIIIEDGYVKGEDMPLSAAPETKSEKKTWKAGSF